MTETSNPPPTQTSAGRCLSQWDSYLRSSGIEEFRVPSFHAGILEVLETATGLLDDVHKTCLDVGCGRQPLKPRLSELGFRYDSCDVVQNLDGTVDRVFPLDEPLPDSFSRTWDALGTLMHSAGAAPSQKPGPLNTVARTAWRAFKFLVLSAARSHSVPRVLPLTGNVPMGTIIVAQKRIAPVLTSNAGLQPSP